MKLLVAHVGNLHRRAGIGMRAEAQNYPWCAMLSMGDQAINCGFVSCAQCMAPSAACTQGFTTPEA